MRSSAASSIVTSRSARGTKAVSAASVVVFPLPVPRDEQVAPRPHRQGEHVEHRPVDRPEPDQVVAGEGASGEAADRQGGAVERKGRDDRVHARPVGQAGVDHRARLVHAPPEGCQDAIDHVEQVGVVVEPRRDRRDAPAALDEHPRRAADHDLGHVRVAQQRLERPEPERLVDDGLDQGVAAGGRQDPPLLGDHVVHEVGEVLAGDVAAAGPGVAGCAAAQVLDQPGVGHARGRLLEDRVAHPIASARRSTA
jgi:hypothetical protein